LQRCDDELALRLGFLVLAVGAHKIDTLKVDTHQDLGRRNCSGAMAVRQQQQTNVTEDDRIAEQNCRGAMAVQQQQVLCK
jgi:hypothetical protein